MLVFSITYAGVNKFNNNWLNPQNVPLQEKIGQMLLVGFSGETYNKEVAEYINKYHVGGIILFNKSLNQQRKSNITSPKQLKKLASNLQKNSKVKLFISADVEGGLVARLSSANGFTDFDSPQKIGEGSVENAYNQANSIGKMLASNGINFNFSPVVDVNVNPNNPVIGKLQRSFSSNPKKVVQYATATIKGLHNNNIITSIKHFPGHGSSSADSHQGFVDITQSYQSYELNVYKDLINNGYKDAVMTAHVVNRNIDKNYPASLSKIFNTDILRNQLNYQGLIITDDLKMGAITKLWSLQDTLVLAINAGADILLYGNNIDDYNPNFVKDAVEIITNAVNSGKIDIKRIDEAYVRIIKLKQQYLYK